LPWVDGFGPAGGKKPKTTEDKDFGTAEIHWYD
jgi:hypothetical protein